MQFSSDLKALYKYWDWKLLYFDKCLILNKPLHRLENNLIDENLLLYLFQGIYLFPSNSAWFTSNLSSNGNFTFSAALSLLILFCNPNISFNETSNHFILQTHLNNWFPLLHLLQKQVLACIIIVSELY